MIGQSRPCLVFSFGMSVYVPMFGVSFLGAVGLPVGAATAVMYNDFSINVK